MKILLLGGFGFIGTNILKFAETFSNDYSFIVFDRFPCHLDNIVFKKVENVYSGDFSDEYLLDKIFEENSIDIVFHSLSASVPSSSVDNIFDLKFNVIPTISLLNVMKKHNVKKIVFISSGGAVYGDKTVSDSGHCEKDVLFPKSAYGVSKLVIEKYLYLYSSLYEIDSLIVRLSNPYGPYHYSQKQGVINIAIEKAMKGDSLEIWGDGKGMKDYIYIDDVSKILFHLLELNIGSYNVVNLGSGQLLSVNEIALSIRKNYYPDFKWDYKYVNKLDVASFKLDLSKLSELVPSLSFTTFEEGLKKSIDWYKGRTSK